MDIVHSLSSRELDPLRKYLNHDVIGFGTANSNTLWPTMVENEWIEFPGMSSYDKIFASCWLSDNQVTYGTKNNKFGVWNLENNKWFEVPLPCSRERKNEEPLTPSCGIHDIGLNPSKTLLATGAENPSHISLFKLPSLTPQKVLWGHSDWSFSMKFVSDDRLVSCSRDTSVGIWNTNGKSNKPLQLNYDHSDKVRNVQVDQFHKRFATLSYDRTVRLWDSPTFTVTSIIPLYHLKESVCMEIEEDKHLLFVGSTGEARVFDIRTAKVAAHIYPETDQWGIRSFCFKGNNLLIGSGNGRVFCYDIRKDHFNCFHGNLPFITAKNGYIDEKGNGIWQIPPEETPQAIYTLSFDPSNMNLFLGGGPLLFDIKGCYASIWG